MLVTSLSYSQGTATSTSHHDSFYVSVLYKHVVKANQAYTEVKYKRAQIDTLESIIVGKDRAFNRMKMAYEMSHELNQGYLTIFKAQQVKIRECEGYASTIESKNKKLAFRQGFMQIGTPLIAVAVGAAGFIVGYYVAKALP